MQPQPAISIQKLVKRYGHLTAVKELSLEVFPGEIFGFLGLNGAGKTTTIRVLLDLLRPSAGQAFVLGQNCQTAGLKVRRRVGYMPGELGLYGDMTGRELLNLLARLSGQPAEPSQRKRILDAMELSLADVNRKLREYSTGMKRKLGIVQAFQSTPDLLILDEPTEGLDPLMQQAFYELAFQTKREGRTLFMSSHVLSEVERVCDRIGLISRGELVLLSTVEELKKMVARRVTVTFGEDVIDRSPSTSESLEVVETRPRNWTLLVKGELGPLIAALHGLPVRDLEIEEPHLEEVLIRYYRGGEQ